MFGCFMFTCLFYNIDFTVCIFSHVLNVKSQNIKCSLHGNTYNKLVKIGF